MTKKIINRTIEIGKLSKNRIKCEACGGYGFTAVQVSPHLVRQRECNSCYGIGSTPNPDWLDILYRRYN